MSAMMEASCSYCRGSGRTESPLTIALKVRKEVLRNYIHTDHPCLLIEVHPNPEHAVSDGIQSLKPDKFAAMMTTLARFAEAADRALAPTAH